MICRFSAHLPFPSTGRDSGPIGTPWPPEPDPVPPAALGSTGKRKKAKPQDLNGTDTLGEFKMQDQHHHWPAAMQLVSRDNPARESQARGNAAHY